MEPITRSDLEKKFIEHKQKQKEIIIQSYVTKIYNQILRLNEVGDKKYVYSSKYSKDTYEKEKEEIINEIVKRLQAIFIDCDIQLIEKENLSTIFINVDIVVNW